MKFLKIGIVVLVIVVLLVLYLGQKNIEEPKVCFDEACFLVEVVKDPEDRQQGLMYRTTLEENNGMLFIFEAEGIYNFWMKNTLIPLDIIWMDKDQNVVFVNENSPPCESDPCPIISTTANALYVLEINAGKASETGITVGKKAEFTGIDG